MMGRALIIFIITLSPLVSAAEEPKQPKNSTSFSIGVHSEEGSFLTPYFSYLYTYSWGNAGVVFPFFIGRYAIELSKDIPVIEGFAAFLQIGYFGGVVGGYSFQSFGIEYSINSNSFIGKNVYLRVERTNSRFEQANATNFGIGVKY